MTEIKPVLDAGITCGESPIWVPEEKALYFTDIPGKALHRFEPGSGDHRSWPMPEELCSFALREKGGFIGALRSGFALIDLDQGSVDYIARPEAHKPDNRLNDGRCDRQGRFFAGSMNEPREAFEGVLYRLDTDHRCTPVANGVIVSNGLAWSPDGRTMYWSDSFNSRVYAFDYDGATGEAKNQRPFYQTTIRQGRPDGAAIDAAGYYWSACYKGSRILRIGPDGTLDREIEMPVRDITMVCFGGEDLKTLYITTSKEALSEEERAANPLAGAVFTLDCGFRGLPETRYKG